MHPHDPHGLAALLLAGAYLIFVYLMVRDRK